MTSRRDPERPSGAGQPPGEGASPSRIGADCGPGGEAEEGAPIELPITDVLDLHPFRPADVPDVVREYLDAACERGLKRLRIIHGKGTGTQRRTVRTLLERDPRVTGFGDAPLEAGSWGATWVDLE